MECIYLKSKEDLTFDSDEHIIPAGLGGIMKLDGQVSDEANNQFSKHEMRFMRESIVSLFRSFEGPGKRGSLSSKKSSKSKIHLLKSDDEYEFELGYISNGSPVLLPQLRFKIDEKSGKFSIDKRLIKNAEISSNDLLNNMSKLWRKRKFRFRHIKFHEFNESFVILAEYNNDWYIATHSNVDSGKLREIHELLQTIVSNKKEEVELGNNHFEPQVSMRLSIVTEDYRMIAKMAFNYLAHKRGTEYVLDDKFDKIRDWIVSGEGNVDHMLVGDTSKLNFLHSGMLPEMAHSVYITYIDRDMIGVVSLYGGLIVSSVRMVENCEKEFELYGYVCDWKNRKDYDFFEYINSLENS